MRARRARELRALAGLHLDAMHFRADRIFRSGSVLPALIGASGPDMSCVPTVTPFAAST